LEKENIRLEKMAVVVFKNLFAKKNSIITALVPNTTDKNLNANSEMPNISIQ
jgi:hypothetical protein